MRWIFLSLVLVNAMFFIWRYILPVSSPARAQEKPVVEFLPANILANDTIRLLEEVRDQETSSPQPLVMSAPEKGELIVNSATNKSANQVHAINKVSVVNDELPVKTLGSISSAVSATSSAAITASKVCYWTGPFTGDSERAVILARLKKLKVAAEVVDIAGLRHWVYLPAKATREDAVATVQSLKAQGVESYIISSGQHRLGVSVGLYTQQALAEQKMRELQRRGWSPVMDTYERATGERWLSVNKKDLDAVGDSVLSVMLKNKSNLKVLEKKCN